MHHFSIFLNALSRVTDHHGVLGEDSVIYPPENWTYWATPTNAVCFASMCVDGVHDAVLQVDGEVRNDSPVIQISPMDFDEPHSLLAPSFLDYLAIGCDASPEVVATLMRREEQGEPVLLDFLRANFEGKRLWDETDGNDIGPCRHLMQLRDVTEP